MKVRPRFEGFHANVRMLESKLRRITINYCADLDPQADRSVVHAPLIVRAGNTADCTPDTLNMAAIDMSINGSRLVGDARRNAADEADWSPAATTSAGKQTMTKCLHAEPLSAETLPTVNSSR